MKDCHDHCPCLWTETDNPWKCCYCDMTNPEHDCFFLPPGYCEDHGDYDCDTCKTRKTNEHTDTEV